MYNKIIKKGQKYHQNKKKTKKTYVWINVPIGIDVNGIKLIGLKHQADDAKKDGTHDEYLVQRVVVKVVLLVTCFNADVFASTVF